VGETTTSRKVVGKSLAFSILKSFFICWRRAVLCVSEILIE
jgi:hypothetical protein